MIHELKLSERFFDAVMNGYKDFEVRKNDRGFMVGDILIMREIDDDGTDLYKMGLGDEQRKVMATIKYILTDRDFPDGIKEGYCILGLTGIKVIQ